MIDSVISRLVLLVFGTLYPAYTSFKAVCSQKDEEYLKWLMYWIVFAFFTSFETFTDTLLSWFPFYYEMKVIVVLWLLSPTTEGSSVLYLSCVHPMLINCERGINEYMNKVKGKGFMAMIQLGRKDVENAAIVIVPTVPTVDQVTGALSVASTTTEPRRSNGRRTSVIPDPDLILELSDDIPDEHFSNLNYEESDESDPEFDHNMNLNTLNEDKRINVAPSKRTTRKSAIQKTKSKTPVAKRTVCVTKF